MKRALPWIILVVILSVLIMTIMVNNRLSKANTTISRLDNLDTDIDAVLDNHFSKLPTSQPNQPLKEVENAE